MTVSKRKGRLQLWCQTCDTWIYFNRDSDYRGRCPVCHTQMRIRCCNRCGHKWTARSAPSELSGQCPNKKCCSPLWCRERMLKRRVSE